MNNVHRPSKVWNHYRWTKSLFSTDFTAKLSSVLLNLITQSVTEIIQREIY